MRMGIGFKQIFLPSLALVVCIYEQSITEGTTFTVPLIEGKFLEFPYARITMYNPAYQNCTLDWQRHNNQWITIDKGSLEECIQKAELYDWFN